MCTRLLRLRFSLSSDTFHSLLIMVSTCGNACGDPRERFRGVREIFPLLTVLRSVPSFMFVYRIGGVLWEYVPFFLWNSLPYGVSKRVVTSRSVSTVASNGIFNDRTSKSWKVLFIMMRVALAVIRAACSNNG